MKDFRVTDPAPMHTRRTGDRPRDKHCWITSILPSEKESSKGSYNSGIASTTADTRQRAASLQNAEHAWHTSTTKQAQQCSARTMEYHAI